MVPKNRSPSRTHLSPSSSSSSAQFQFPLFPPLMTPTIPNPNPDFLQFPITHPIPNFADDDRTQTRDLGFANNTPSMTIFPHTQTQTQTQTPRAPHWPHHQQQQTPLHSLPTEIGLPDQHEFHIDRFVAQLLKDNYNPNTDCPDPLLPGSSSSFNGPDDDDDDERDKGFLKRGTVDYLGIGLSIGDHNATPKRTKTTATTGGGGGLYNGNLNFGFESPSASEQDHGDRKGKRKLYDHDVTDTNGAGERVVVIVDDDDENEGDDRDDDVVPRRFGREEEMKEPVIEFDFWSGAFNGDAFRAQIPDNSNFDVDLLVDDDYAAHLQQGAGSRRRERFRDIAKENASRFARFEPDAEDNKDGVGSSSSSPETQVEPPIDDGPSPFSAAMKSLKEKGVKNVQTKSWVPKRNEQDMMGARLSVPPSLKELCLKILANNADAIVSLDGVPDDLRHRLSQLLCDSRKMNSHSFELLVSGSPTEIRLRDCSWLSEEQFLKSFNACDTANLEVLQLDQCGHCIPDYILEQPPRWLHLPRLTSLSLSGACRLSDKGLRVLVSSAPALRSINLSQCSLLTSASIDTLADSLGSLLKELYLDDCLNIDAAQIVPALKKLEHIEVLSLSGMQNVCDKFIKDYIIARGHSMKELVLKDCVKLTDVSMKVIADHCPGLCVLDLINLCKLTDLSIGYLANSCRALHTLKLCRSPFSDEAIAAFIEITGESLKELSLNNIRKVGRHTTLSLASHAKNLHTLDLSWCRNLVDEELGLIVDSCFSLRLLKLFGCSQVTDVFLDGYSNPSIEIIGLKMSPLLKHVKVHDPHQGALRYSAVSLN